MPSCFQLSCGACPPRRRLRLAGQTGSGDVDWPPGQPDRGTPMAGRLVGCKLANARVVAAVNSSVGSGALRPRRRPGPNSSGTGASTRPRPQSLRTAAARRITAGCTGPVGPDRQRLCAVLRRPRRLRRLRRRSERRHTRPDHSGGLGLPHGRKGRRIRNRRQVLRVIRAVVLSKPRVLVHIERGKQGQRPVETGRMDTHCRRLRRPVPHALRQRLGSGQVAVESSHSLAGR